MARLLLIVAVCLFIAGSPESGTAHSKPTSIACGGYTVRQDLVAGADEPERLTIQRGTKTMVTISSFGEIDSKCADVTGDRQPDLIFQTFTGGAHCCFDIYVYQFTPTLRRILFFQASNAGGFEVRTLGGRIVLELGDDSFAYYEDLCYVCSPSRLPLAACYGNGRFSDCTRQFPQLLPHYVNYYSVNLKEAMNQTDASRSAFMRGAALGIYAAYALMGKAGEGVPAVNRVTNDATVIKWLASQRPAVQKWLTTRGTYLKR